MPPSGTRRTVVLSELIAFLPLIRPPAAHPRNPSTHIMAQSARRALVTLFALLLLGGFPQSAWPQQPRIHYVYDDLGRLVGVVDQDGNAATYTYDAVGNILAIGRHNVADTSGPVAITLVAPNKGKVGTAVSIFGRGFSADAAQDVASFSGAIATVTAATTNTLTTSVPPGALTGPITVTAPLGTATSSEAFRVLGVVTITPTSAVLFPTHAQQFTATESGNTSPSVAWSVNGVSGGNATVGTITSAGLYTAPTAIPSPTTVTVTAISTDDVTLTASASVGIVLPPDRIVAHSVSISSGGLSGQPALLTAPPVSVGVATVPIVVNTLMAGTVSVGVGGLSGQAALLTASPVGIAREPVIVTVTPSTGARGVAGLAVGLTGAGLTSASSVSFEVNGANDTNLSVTNLTVGPDGTEATFTLSIATGAVPGLRVVRITTPGGASTAVGTGGNQFTAQ